MLCLHNKDLSDLFPVGDAVWDAGDRPGGLAEEHNLQALCSKQQTDPLVLAGTSVKSDCSQTSQTARAKHHF